MPENKYQIYSVSVSRILIGLAFLFIGALNIIFIDSTHQAGVLFPLPYFVTTGLPPALFGLGILLHTLVTSCKFTIMRVENDIHVEEKFIFRKNWTIMTKDLSSIKFGDTKNRYKYAILGLWMVYVIFTLKSGLHQLNALYGGIMISSGVVVFLLCLLLLFCKRKEFVVETTQGRIWANLSKLDIQKLREIFQLPDIQIKKSATFNIRDYTSLTIGGFFIITSLLIYFLLPFSTFVDLFLLIYGLKLILAHLQNSWGTLTYFQNESNLILYNKGPFQETLLFAKNIEELKHIKQFKPLHPFELAIIAFLAFQTIYATIRAAFIDDTIFFFQSLLLTTSILFALAIIIFRLLNYLPISRNTYFPLLISLPAQTPDLKQKSNSSYLENLVKFSQIKAFYARIIFLFIVIFTPLLIFTFAYPFLV